MPRKKSIWTEVVQDLKDTVGTFRFDADKSKKLPFMMQAADPRTSRRHLERLTPKQRKTLIKERGLEEVIRLVQDNRRG